MHGGDDDESGSRVTPDGRRTSSAPPAARRTGSTRPPARATGRPPDLLASARRLASMDFDLVSAARRIVEGWLGLVLGDNLVVVTDAAMRGFADVLADAAAMAGGTGNVYEASGVDGALPEELEEMLRRAQIAVVLLNRGPWLEALAAAGREHQLRVGALPGATRKGILATFAADPARIAEASGALRHRLRPDALLRVRSPAGTDLTVQLDGRRWLERSGAVRAGRTEVLPLAQFVAVPASVQGTFVADGGASEELGGDLARTPLHLTLESGVVKQVKSRDAALERRLDHRFASERESAAVAAVLLGTNVALSDPTGEVLFDATLPGLHMVLGVGWLEGESIALSRRHSVLTGGHADVDLDGVPLVRAGHIVTSAGRV